MPITGSQEEEILSFHKIKYGILKKIVAVILITVGIVVIKFEICPKIVVSGSMEPNLPVGSICLIARNYPVEKIKEGDIIAFSVDGTIWVTHRVVKRVGDNHFLTKGDANETIDIGTVSERQYRGKTIASIPYLGFFSLFCFQKREVILIISFIFILGQTIGRRKSCK